MSEQSKAYLKTRFDNGAIPNSTDFSDLIDSTYSVGFSSLYTTVYTNSATWQAAGAGGVTQIVAGTNVTVSPAGGTGVVTVNATGGSTNLGEVPVLSGNWNSNYTTTNTYSGLWQSVYTTVSAFSASWEESADITALQNSITSIAVTSGNWNSNYTTTNTNSALWDSVYTTVSAFSASWEESADITALQNNLNNVAVTSGNWNSNYTTTNTYSGNWNNALPSTGGTITGNLVINQSLTADKIELKESSLDVGTSLSNSLSTLYMTINGIQYAIPVLKVPLVNASGNDVASNAAYDDGWADTDNGGTGFGPWELVISQDGVTSFAGTYINSSDGQGFGNIDTSGEAFGMYANPGGSGAMVEALRPLTTPLTVGNALSIALAAAYRSGSRKFQLWGSDDSLLWEFSVESDEYRVDGANLGWSYSQSSIFNVVAKQIDLNTINVTVTRGSDVSVKNVTGKVAKIYLEISNTNGGSDLENFRFNSLNLYPYQ